MVSFQCDACTDVVKKPKLDNHYGKCYASFTCVDCSTTFQTPREYKGHTSCISEAEKYQKGLFKGKKNGQANHGTKSHKETADGNAIPPARGFEMEAVKEDAGNPAGKSVDSMYLSRSIPVNVHIHGHPSPLYGEAARGSAWNKHGGGRGRGAGPGAGWGGGYRSRPFGTGANDTPLGTPTHMASPPLTPPFLSRTATNSTASGASAKIDVDDATGKGSKDDWKEKRDKNAKKRKAETAAAVEIVAESITGKLTVEAEVELLKPSSTLKTKKSKKEKAPTPAEVPSPSPTTPVDAAVESKKSKKRKQKEPQDDAIPQTDESEPKPKKKSKKNADARVNLEAEETPVALVKDKKKKKDKKDSRGKVEMEPSEQTDQTEVAQAEKPSKKRKRSKVGEAEITAVDAPSPPEDGGKHKEEKKERKKKRKVIAED